MSSYYFFNITLMLKYTGLLIIKTCFMVTLFVGFSCSMADNRMNFTSIFSPRISKQFNKFVAIKILIREFSVAIYYIYL